MPFTVTPTASPELPDVVFVHVATGSSFAAYPDQTRGLIRISIIINNRLHVLSAFVMLQLVLWLCRAGSSASARWSLVRNRL